MGLEIPFGTIAQGLQQFKGVKRRFDIRWRDVEERRVIVDDYAHHPTEIAATLEAARGFWPGRIVSVFQPHRFSRTLNCKDGFVSAFHQSDVVLISDIYSAGEDPISGVDSESLVAEIKKVARSEQDIIYSGDLTSTRKILSRIFKDGDLILCLGAGSITRLPDQIIAEIESVTTAAALPVGQA
jgi:UDP-N-acetylmuramate--alanine ligase